MKPVFPFLARRGQENQGETALFAGKAADFLKADQAEKGDRGVRIGHANHAVEKFGHRFIQRFIDIFARFIVQKGNQAQVPGSNRETRHVRT